MLASLRTITLVWFACVSVLAGRAEAAAPDITVTLLGTDRRSSNRAALAETCRKAAPVR